MINKDSGQKWFKISYSEKFSVETANLYCEIDGFGKPLRSVELFRDGSRDCADVDNLNGVSGKTFLPETNVSDADIYDCSINGVSSRFITKSEFESIWRATLDLI